VKVIRSLPQNTKLGLSGAGKTLPEKQFEGTPLHVPDRGRVKLCPECGRILINYGVVRDLNFTLEQCGHCHGVWFDKNEWG
jgi:hypothetical protein